MEDVIDAALLNIGTRAEHFGIENNGDIMAIANQLIHATELVLVGAGGSKTYTDWLGTSVSRTESVNVADRSNIPRSRKEGFVSSLKRQVWM